MAGSFWKNVDAYLGSHLLAPPHEYDSLDMPWTVPGWGGVIKMSATD